LEGLGADGGFWYTVSYTSFVVVVVETVPLQTDAVREEEENTMELELFATEVVVEKRTIPMLNSTETSRATLNFELKGMVIKMKF
jgi:hypothetical protein